MCGFVLFLFFISNFNENYQNWSKTGGRERKKSARETEENGVNCLRDSDKCVGASDLMEFAVNKCWFCRKFCKIKRIIEPINRIVCSLIRQYSWWLRFIWERRMERNERKCGEKKRIEPLWTSRDERFFLRFFFSTTTTVMLVTTNKDTITLTENTNNFSIFHFNIFVVVCSFVHLFNRSPVSFHSAIFPYISFVSSPLQLCEWIACQIVLIHFITI